MVRNHTTIKEFILLGFQEFSELRILFFFTFLTIYILTIMGNILVLLLIILDPHLKSPMYFFLGNLSFLEACYSSNIFPRMISALLTGNRRISFNSCFTQLYFFGSLVSSECCLLCVMSYDRYLAICKPLHYATIMKSWTCIQLVAVSWINGFVALMVLLVLMLQLNFCNSNEIDHYFCEYFPILRLSCSDISMVQNLSFLVASVFTFPSFLLTLTSYIYIIVAILNIPSATGRQKAFSTCSSHLIVVFVFYGSLIIVYMTPKAKIGREMQKIFSLLYTVLPPLLNPFIYSLRNKEVKDSLRKNICRNFHLLSKETRGKLLM
ncbi:olfactory receptor 2AP1-like [Thamnophis elegans]|uniref:olfactory receptor 2AP1-like n=1 Tax=Thamnophis elegans TaxID=35005 RepID=UPI001376A448|nr:olfactory receptor 2AP1-like [Thamnophis elegans]